MINHLNFECDAHQLESHFASLRRIQAGSPVDIGEEIHRLRSQAAATRRSICEGLSAWHVAQVAGHTQFLTIPQGAPR